MASNAKTPKNATVFCVLVSKFVVNSVFNLEPTML